MAREDWRFSSYRDADIFEQSVATGGTYTFNAGAGCVPGEAYELTSTLGGAGDTDEWRITVDGGTPSDASAGVGLHVVPSHDMPFRFRLHPDQTQVKLLNTSGSTRRLALARIDQVEEWRFPAYRDAEMNEYLPDGIIGSTEETTFTGVAGETYEIFVAADDATDISPWQITVDGGTPSVAANGVGIIMVPTVVTRMKVKLRNDQTTITILNGHATASRHLVIARID